MSDKKEARISPREISSSSSSAQWPLHGDVEAQGKGTSSSLPQWPTEPQPLEQSKLSYWVGIIIDVALIVAPLLLIMKTALVIYAYKLDERKSGLPGDPVSNLTLKLTEFNSQLVTLFTVIFITTVATVVRRYALYKAQVGASVTQLEQYQASISLPSTLKMIVLLRAWSWVSLLLVFVWSWYYLGSQAASREYTYVLSDPLMDTKIGFGVSNGPSIFDDITNITSIAQKEVDARWIGSFATYTWQVGTDLEGSAIAPFLVQAPDVEMLTASKGGWLKFGQQTAGKGAPLWSSSLGRAVWASTGNSASSAWIGSYTATYSYLYTTCEDLQLHNTTEFPAGTLPTFPTSINATNPDKDGFPVIDLWKRTVNLTWHTTCTLGEQFVDVKVGCNGIKCAVNEFRATPSKSALQPATYFSNTNRTNAFFSALLLADGIPRDLEPITYFDINLGIALEDGKWVQQCAVNSTATMCLSQSLSQLVNGYYTASQPGQGRWGFLLLSFDEIPGILNGSAPNPTWSSGAASGALYDPHYQLTWAWVGFDLATCVVLFICAIFSFRLHKITVAPDIFGYVSSMTRDNPNLRLPEGGSAMSGVDRARALKNVKVKLTDLNTDGTVAGRIGLTRADDAVRDKRLSRTKNYL